MKDSIKIILDDLKKHLIRNYGKSIKDVILFGSQSRGEGNKFSDYDILILLDKVYTGRDENRILDLCFDINLKHNIILDVHLISESELNSLRGSQPIFQNALKHGLYA